MTNVRDFGATGDGTTDDTQSIEHAIEEGDGYVLFPRGTYRITRTIEVALADRGHTALDGEGGTASIIMDGAGPALRFVGTHDRTADPDSIRDAVWQRERLPTVSNIEIIGEHDDSDGIELQGTMQATLRGVLIRRCRYGLHLVKRNRNLLLADSHIYHGRGPAIGVYFDAVNLHQAIIVGSHISYCKHAGIKIRASEIRNLQITGNDIEYNHDDANNDSADVWIDSREGTVREGTIASNTIQAKNSPGGANVRIEGLDIELANKAGLWTISGNVIQSQAVNLLLRSCRGVVVTGNSFASGYHRSIVLEKCRHILVGSNTFDYNPDYSGERVDGITLRQCSGCSLANLILEATRSGDDNSGGAIELFDSSDIAITACQVLDPVHRGIYLSNVQRSRVSDCSIFDRRVPHQMIEALRVAGAGRSNFISHNLVHAGTRGSIEVEDGGATLDGNRLVEDPGS